MTIYWDGQQISYRASDATTYFEHQDWLGTERMRTNYNGAVAATFTSLPWGDGSSATIGGTGADQDNAIFAALDEDTNASRAAMSDHAQFRNYSFSQGRWLSPDPYDGSYDITNPQSFNRYAYALNNPLSFVDPSGLDCEGTEGGYDGDGCGPGDCDNYADPCGGNPNPDPPPPYDPCAGADDCVTVTGQPGPEPNPYENVDYPYLPNIPSLGFVRYSPGSSNAKPLRHAKRRF